MSESDHELITACRRGETRAWERVIDKYERLVYSIALKYGASAEDAADVTQVTFTILMQSLDNLQPDTRLAPWLATVAKRHTWRVLAKRRREPVGAEEDVADQEWIRQSDANPIEAWERVEWLRSGLIKLDKRCRELLTYLYFDPGQPSYIEAADNFEMPVGSVGPTRVRCLEKLKSIMLEAVQPA